MTFKEELKYMYDIVPGAFAKLLAPFKFISQPSSQLRMPGTGNESFPP